ncbi:MAG TPA: HEAT repeat domain-containing protein [Anaerolineales bacterium]|nr:HEAT repeat domain-containing protein [Anaerolineales bacterium]
MSEAARLIGELLSDDEARAEAAVLALGALGAPGLDIVLPLFDSPVVETRWWAVRAAAEIPVPRAASALAAALEDDDPGVRQAAALGLRLQPTPAAVPALIRRLADPDPLLARLASDALAAVGVAALPDLHRAATDAETGRRIHAVRALSLMKDPAVVSDLFAALEDPSTLVRHWAERGLEDLGVGMVFFPAG